jgi:hypothetical protein
MKSDVHASAAATALRCWIEGKRVCLELSDRRLVSFPVKKFSRLAHASATELEKVQLRLQGRALRWETLDEDIWVEDVAKEAGVGV